MIMDKNVILAKKYGRAIYDIAAETQSLESIGNDLKLIADTLKENAELSNLLTHPIPVSYTHLTLPTTERV